MDPDVRPQDDLFRHVNGRWLDTTEIPSDRSAWGAFVVLAERSEERVREIIEGLADGEHEAGSNAQKIGDLFTSFMDEQRIEDLGAEPIRADLETVAGLADVPGLAEFVGGLERRGGSGFFGAYVNTDDRDSDRYLVTLVQGGIGLPDESYYREEKFADIRTAYLSHLEKMLALASWPEPAAAARQVLDVETRLAKGHWERAETRDVVKAYNLTTFAGLEELAPSLAWRTWATALGANDETLRESIVAQPSYLQHLSTALDEVSLDDWKAWLAIRVVRAASPYLSSVFVAENFEFYGRTLNGTPELRARWKRGVSFVEGSIGEAVGEEYVARHFPPRAKETMDELVANLLEAYRRNIEALDWMTDETKQRAFDKLETFRPKIGYPDKFRDYSALEVAADDLLGNVRAAAAFETDRELRKIGSPVDRDEWFMLPQTVNAYYNPGMNEICFPAGILQPPFFDADADDGRELRRHRRGHRPRDRARLRRPGLAVRRRGQPARLVDRRGQGRVPGARRQADRAVRRLRAARPAGRARQRRAHGRREHRRPRRADHRAQGLPDHARGPGHPGGRRADRRAAGVLELRARVALQAAQGTVAAAAHGRPAQPGRVPRQHRAQPRRVPRSLRHRARRRALAGAGGARPDLVAGRPPERWLAQATSRRARFGWHTPAMDVLRTPEERFSAPQGLPGFDHPPSYAEVPDGEGGTLRMAYVETGPANGPVALLLHGEPSWSFLYRHVMDVLAADGVRAVAPDLVGFGRSDKPTQAADHTFARHVEWVRALAFDVLDLREVTLVGQDWGGLIGLRLVAEHPDRFAGVVAANTGLPTGDLPMPDIWWQFRRAVETSEHLDVGRLVQAGCVTPMDDAVRAAYDAPFPDETYKAGPRVMPTLVPTSPDDPATEANRAAWQNLTKSPLPFLVAFSDGDPITGDMAPILRREMPGARDLEHPVIEGAGHFLQEDAGDRLGTVVARFMRGMR